MMQKNQFSASRLGPLKGMRGLSLVELLVSISIGLLIVTAMATLLANNSNSRAEIDLASRKLENGRYALNELATDIQNAGYLAEFDPRVLITPVAKPDPCLTDADSLQAALPMHVQGYDNVSSSVLSCLSDVKAGTDIMVIRRVNGCAEGATDCTALVSGDMRFQASSCGGTTELGSGVNANFFRLTTLSSALTLTKRDCTTVADVRKYIVRIYYVANNDKSGDAIPTLKRAELTGGSFVATSVAQGIQDMQIEFGLDTPGTGAATKYTPAPDLYLSCSAITAPTCAAQWRSVVSAKVFLLARNLDKTSGYSDSKTYVLGRNADGTSAVSGSAKTVGPFSDSFKRGVFNDAFRFQNPSARNAS